VTIQTTDCSLVLPWPPIALSPNARTHWRKKAPIAKAYKEACWALAKEAKLVVPDDQGLALWLDFYPPDRRHRDDDNVIASFKAGRDGLALALGIDDKRFRCFPYLHTEIGGFVRVRITELPKVP
jgi:crossover junction endodeoxyribonuclease RusA